MLSCDTKNSNQILDTQRLLSQASINSDGSNQETLVPSKENVFLEQLEKKGSGPKLKTQQSIMVDSMLGSDFSRNRRQ